MNGKVRRVGLAITLIGSDWELFIGYDTDPFITRFSEYEIPMLINYVNIFDAFLANDGCQSPWARMKRIQQT